MSKLPYKIHYIYINESKEKARIMDLKEGDYFRYIDEEKVWMATSPPYVNENFIWTVLADPV